MSIADGGDCPADLSVLRGQPELSEVVRLVGRSYRIHQRQQRQALHPSPADPTAAAGANGSRHARRGSASGQEVDRPLSPRHDGADRAADTTATTPSDAGRS